MSEALNSYYRLEAAHAPWRLAGVGVAVGVVVVAACQWLFPRMPAPAIDLMKTGFRLDDMAAVVLFNDYAAVYFVAEFVGLVGLLGVVAVPREERRLELLLAKPVPASALLAARTWPVLGMTAAVGLGISLACAASAWSMGGSVEPAGALGSGLLMTALVVLELAALGVVFVRSTDTMQAVLIALLVALAPLMPTATFLYRPDLFVGRDGLASALVTASTVWHGGTLAWLGPLALVVALAAGWLLIGVAGRRLARAGV
jgi:ABC-type Na+ efflux pump permease subunit